ncbi:hypothetical protein QFZ65_000816 [Arthrobacter sp. B3I9]|nr:hypothetical protein [Arthrobacter sp. B3I9]
MCQHVDRQPDTGGDGLDVLRCLEAGDKDPVRPGVGVGVGPAQDGSHGGLFAEPDVVNAGVDEHRRAASLGGGNFRGKGRWIDKVAGRAVLQVDPGHAQGRQLGYIVRHLIGVLGVAVLYVRRHVDRQSAHLRDQRGR